MRKRQENTMLYKTHYESPLGDLLLTADAQALTGVWFDGQKYYAQGQADLEPEAGAAICNAPCKEELAPLLADVKRWLDIYFAGKAWYEPCHGAEVTKEYARIHIYAQ